jgi:hypothetical protein
MVIEERECSPSTVRWRMCWTVLQRGQGYIDMTGDELQRTEDISKAWGFYINRYRTIQSKSYFEITVWILCFLCYHAEWPIQQHTILAILSVVTCLLQCNNLTLLTNAIFRLIAHGSNQCLFHSRWSREKTSRFTPKTYVVLCHLPEVFLKPCKTCNRS